MVAKFVAEEGLLKGMTLPLEGATEWVLGRDPDESQIILEDPSVSRKHLALRVSPQGILAENLSETNPILINDEEVSEPQLLKSGDSIKIGDGYYRYFSEEGAEGEAAADLSPESLHADDDEERDTIFEEVEEGEEPTNEIDIDLSDSSPWLMKVVSGPNNGAQFSMYPDTSYVIGSDPANCDIVFHDVSVSRQHARLTVGKDNSLSIEDLGSSNGTYIESEKIEARQSFSPNTLISVGTTSLIIYDRQGERSTIVSPLLPEIVKILQQEEPAEEEVRDGQEAQQEEEVAIKTEERPKQTVGSFFFLAMITGIFLIVGIATLFLFQAEEITEPQFNEKQVLKETITQYPSVEWQYNPSTGRLLLVGHVITSVDRNQLIYTVNALPFVKEVDNNVIVDELIWQEHNQVLAKNPEWRGVTITAPSPGKFVISGYIQTRGQADNLSDYLGQNFPYLDLLEQRIIVEEDILNRVTVLLKDAGFNAVDINISNGSVVLTGDIPYGEKEEMQKIVGTVRQITGVRDVRSYVTELPPADTMVDLTGQYRVTGSLTQPNGETSVVINGRILSEGDSLDGRAIKSIKNGVIMLESGGIKYRIDYNQ